MLNIFLKCKAVEEHDLDFDEFISSQLSQQVLKHALAFDSETQLENFDCVTYILLSLRRRCCLWELLTFIPFLILLLEVNFKGLEPRVKVDDVVVFDAELCDLLGFKDLAVGRPYDTLDDVDALDGSF